MNKEQLLELLFKYKIKIIEHDILNPQFVTVNNQKNFANLQYLKNYHFIILYCL